MTDPVRQNGGWWCDVTGRVTESLPVVPTDDLRFRRASDSTVSVFVVTEDDEMVRVGYVRTERWPQMTATQEAQAVLVCLRPHPYYLHLRLLYPAERALRQQMVYE